MNRRLVLVLALIVALVVAVVVYRNNFEPHQGTALTDLATPVSVGTEWSTRGIVTIASPPLANDSNHSLTVTTTHLDLQGCAPRILEARLFLLTSQQGYLAAHEGGIVVGSKGGGLFVTKGHAVANYRLQPKHGPFFIAYAVHGQRSCTMSFPSMEIDYRTVAGATSQTFSYKIVVHTYTWRP